jgi:hypothetical protein
MSADTGGTSRQTRLFRDLVGFYFLSVHRKLTLKKFSTDNPSEETPKIQRLFTPRSNWRPPIPNKTLETFYRAIKNDLIQENMKNRCLTKDNLSKEDRTFLKSLKENSQIVIKKADKGSAVVMMNTPDYLRVGYDQQFYQKLDHDPTKI